MNKTKRSILSIVLVLTMIIGVLPAYAQDKILAYVTISQYGEFVNDKNSVPLVMAQLELESDSANIDDVLRKAHELYNENGADSYSSYTGDYGLSLGKLWNDESGLFGYYVNGNMAYGLTDTVSNGDHIEAFIYQNAYPDTESYTKFDKSTAVAKVGEVVELVLLQAGYDENWNTVFSPCDGATVTIDGAETEIITDAEGKATVTFDTSAKHTVSAKKSSDEKILITAPVCVVDVTLPEPSWSGSGTAEDEYIIATADDLSELSMLCANGEAFADTYFKMTDDITLPEDWVSIGALKADADGNGNGANVNPFSGTFDGDSHTLTVPNNGKPLFGYVREADILNLNISGTQIDGYGLIDNYSVDYGADGSSYTDDDPQYTAVIDNCVLKSGSSTLNSGFVGGYASGVNAITIRNSTIEEGVTIGYTKDKSNIGGFAGEFNGTIVNCKSSADVYGVDFVGGIVASKGQAMGTFAIYDCITDGTVTATGKYTGGITAGGYGGSDWGFSANAHWPVIKNCIASGSVSGEACVGGIMGAEPGTLQCWESGVGYIQNNLFTGTVSASGEDASVGGVIGFIKAANRYTVISNNYYNETCGADKGIGKIEIVETSESNEKIGEGWCTATLNGTKYGRDDDPMGEGALSLAKVYTEAEYNDGTLLELLNNGNGTSGDWVQSENGIAFGGKKHLLGITSSDLSVMNGLTQKVGDTDVLADKTLTLLYSDGTTETVSADKAEKQYKATNAMDGKSIAASILYNKQELVFMLNIVKGNDNTGGGSVSSDNISVKFKLLGDEKHGEGTTHTLKKNNLKTWIKQTSATVEKGATVLDVFVKVLEDNGYTWVNYNKENGKVGGYIQSITTPDGVTLEEFDNGPNAGWLYTLNGKRPEVGIDEQTVKNGDTIVFHYTDDYKAEVSSQSWSGGGGGGSTVSSISVIFETNGGSAIDKVSVKKNEVLTEPAAPTKDGYTFDGWYTDSKLTTKYDFATKVTKSLKLYAKWAEITEAEPTKAPTVNPFEDVSENAWYYESVMQSYEDKLIMGMTDTSFGPDTNVTRAMFVTILHRLENEPDAEASDFADVEDDAYYFEAVNWAASNGIVSGVSADIFAPDAEITREQMAAVIYRYADFKGFDVSVQNSLDGFDDADKVSEYAVDAFNWAVASSIISGMDENTLSPLTNTTRAQTAAVIQRLLKIIK